MLLTIRLLNQAYLTGPYHLPVKAHFRDKEYRSQSHP